MTHSFRLDRIGSIPAGLPLMGGLLPAALLFLLLALPQGASAQLQSDSRATSQSPPRVFLDCQDRRNCDFDHFRTEIRFVNWVRDRTDADVHVLFTSTGLPDGGRQYQVDFVGRGEMAGRDDGLTYTSAGTDSQRAEVDGVTQALRLGLIRYAVEAGATQGLEISFEAQVLDDDGGDVAGNGNGQASAYDPWDYWTFRFGLSGNMDLRETRTSSRINPSLSANRVTADWKVNSNIWVNLRRDRRTLASGAEIRNDVNTWRVNALVVRSVSDHISVGMDAGGWNSVSNNQRARISMAPAVEYNYYPYEEANRRQLIAHYAAGAEYSDYEEETVFGATRETLVQHRLGVQYRAREEWGNAGVGFESAQYLHDMDLYSFGFSGDVSYRITRGLELNVSGGASFVNDNIHTPVEDIPDEDILLGRRALPSSYQYEASVGFNYRWGSSFANIVNNRFPRSVR